MKKVQTVGRVKPTPAEDTQGNLRVEHLRLCNLVKESGLTGEQQAEVFAYFAAYATQCVESALVAPGQGSSQPRPTGSGLASPPPAEDEDLSFLL
jgi:hypothetical protein